MRKYGKIIIVISSVLLLLQGCEKSHDSKTVEKVQDTWIENEIPGKNSEKQDAGETKSGAEIEMEINAMMPSPPLNLTTEQKLEDFDMYWNTVQAKVYCLEEAAKKRGVDLQSHIANYRESTAHTQDDKEFYEVLQKSTEAFSGVWHMGINLPYSSLKSGLVSTDSFMIQNAVQGENQQKLKYWDTLLTQNDFQYQSSKRAHMADGEMPELRIVNEKAAVITVPSMLYMTQYEKVSELLIEYMKSVFDYEHVIFDLQSNGGGSDELWYDNIIAPNIKAPLEFTRISFSKDTQDVKAYKTMQKVTVRENFVQDTIYPNAPLSEYTKGVENGGNDYGNADSYQKCETKVYPRYDKKILNGKLWVLVYAENYSSAETFVSVCKDTGFATLVGNQTAGNGGAGMALHFALPNSGLTGVVNYNWRLNEDGTNNYNEGTRPDIESPEGEMPLETCLKAIEDYEKRK